MGVEGLMTYQVTLLTRIYNSQHRWGQFPSFRRSQMNGLQLFKPFNSHEWPWQNFSLQYRYKIKQTSDENKEKYQLGDNKLIQYQILQTNITRNVWEIVRRITDKILGVKRLKQFSTKSKLNQDCIASKLKPIMTWSPVFSRAKGFLVFIFNSHWLLVIISCALIGCCDCFGFGFMNSNEEVFQLPHLQSVIISSILCHPYLVLVFLYLLLVCLPW